MPKIKAKLTAPLVALLAAIQCSSALANESRWFKVEMLIVANETEQPPEGAAIPEQWDATPTLAYPLASRFLIDTAAVVNNEAEFAGESLVDDYGRQIITLITDDSGSTPAPAETPMPVPPRPVYQDGGLPEGAAADAVPVVASPSALPRPFVLLPRNYQEFQGKASQMQRSGRYSVLFHETWVQPVGAEARSLPIVLDRSGDTLQWPRLQGTITLFLSRYLHVQTNLWINTAGDYLPGTWQMPAPPLGPPSLIVEEQELVDIAAGTERVMEMDALSVDQQTAPGEDEAVKLMEESGPLYPYRHAVLLSQTRRMRSNEIHYIDHPLFGVIVKFTPVTAEELGAIAVSQAAL